MIHDKDISKRVEQIMASIKSAAYSAGVISRPDWKDNATLETIIETHIRAAIVVGVETSLEDLVDEIQSIGVSKGD